MQLETDIKLDFSDVLIKPKHSTITSRQQVELEREFHFRYSSKKWKGIPIISANMPTVTTRAVVDAMVSNHMLAGIARDRQFPVGLSNYHSSIATIGINEGYPGVFTSFVCLDVANGYMEKFVNKIKKVREQDPDRIIIAGNVVTPEMTLALLLAGADIVKVGIGSGSVCSTRLKTGVGYPQLSAVIECADAAHGLNGHIISDGGCTSPGDIAKAFGAGADFVMLGGMLAGHDENGSEYRGMASRNTDLKDYRASEGWDLKLPNKGPLANTIQEILGGLRSACSYTGATKLKDLPKCTTFVRVNRILNSSLLEYKDKSPTVKKQVSWTKGLEIPPE